MICHSVHPSDLILPRLSQVVKFYAQIVSFYGKVEATSRGVLNVHLYFTFSFMLILLDGYSVELFEQLADGAFGRFGGMCSEFKFHGLSP